MQEPPATLHLTDREEAVLMQLTQEPGALVAFQGLKRQTDLHQQTLTRTLKRLVERGLVQRGPGGYELTPMGTEIMSGTDPAPADPAFRLAEHHLPFAIHEDVILERFVGRWFQALRWHGALTDDGGTTLTWTTEDGRARVRMRVRRRMLQLEVEPAEAAPVVLNSIRPVLAAIADLYAESPRAA